MTEPADPQWIDGLPANLPAAIADALEWLDLLGRRDWLNQENRERVRGCAAALRGHVTPAPRAPGE